MDRDVALLCNPSAGGGRAARVLPQVEEALRGHRIAFHTETTRDLDHGCALAGTAANAGEAVVTLGGDGLVGCVAGALREVPGALLGVLPGGRGNDLARSLGIPRDPRAACAVVATGTPRLLDVGDVDGRTFVGIASLGFDSDANRIANAAPSRLGSLVYVYAALRALAAWKPAHFELRLDGEPVDFTGYSVAAANAPGYGGGMLLAPEAALDDGLLDVVLTGQMSKRRALLVLTKVFKGAHVQERSVRVHRARELHVASDRPFVVYADGDPIGGTPVTIRIQPGALRVLAPA
ncbi:MAG TPA: diacylglycerol kinase family protein [Solirubrobacteraceae bacterium]|nr:diacylglycerol kinase family protein [Solirubrobacteraceae bacterium]